MFTSTTLLLSLPILTLAAGGPHYVPLPQQHRRLARSNGFLRARADPSALAVGSLTTAEGCTKFRSIKVGEYCIQVAKEEGISLSDFYAMNEGIDETCMNLYANKEYCVARTTTSVSAPASTLLAKAAVLVPSSTVAVKTALKVAAAAPVRPSSTATSVAATPTPAPTSTAADDDEDDEDDDEDGECDADDDDDEEDESSTVAAVATSVVQAAAPTTTAAPVAATTTSTSAAPAATTSSAAVVSSLLSELKSQVFVGMNGEGESAIGSWFHADASTDSTNGHSWCGFPYTDATPGFAPSLSRMLQGYGSRELAGPAYCGLEAKMHNPDGTTTIGYIIDAFDDTWVRTPKSIDIMYDLFTKFNGAATNDKNVVVKGVTWELTGNRNEQYKYEGVGAGSS
ncbi:hypothetical protein RQP46_005368 [Phenoliferia psychrophenolica]